MAHLIRGKQIGVQVDFSAGIDREQFKLDEITRYGLNSQVSAVAYDPVQSLLAIGTNETKFGDGQVYVFGQQRVAAVFALQKKASTRQLSFNADKLVCFDSRNDISVWSTDTKRLLYCYSPPGSVTSLSCDPAIDYMFLGMQSGDVLAYDLDRGKLAPFRLPNFWKEHDPRTKISPVVALALHPRDIGSLLIGYSDGAVIFSIKQNKPLKFFRYEIPRGAPGGDLNPMGMNVARHPRLSHAVWHPTGTFILTGHEDGSLVFWDTNQGKIVMARTLTETNINQASSSAFKVAQTSGLNDLKEPLFKIVWCANQDPEDTAIIICGGSSSTSPIKGLTLLEMGRTPNYATSSWDVLSSYVASPKRQRMLPIPPGTEVVDICMIPKNNPYFAGAHDPIAMMALLSSGELVTMSFPSGYPITPTNQLHVSATFVHPFITTIDLSPMDRGKWLGMTEKRSQGPLILKGGAEAVRPKKRFENRNIVQTAHADGTVRLWDAGHGDDIENSSVVEVDVGRVVGQPEGVEITKLSLAGASGELATGTRSGEVVLFRWSRNHRVGRESVTGVDKQPEVLVDVSSRTDPGISEGLLPYTMIDMRNGPTTALKLSDAGFLAAGFEGGSLVVIDLRGPTIILKSGISDFGKTEKRGFGRSARPQSRSEWVTFLEYSVMTLEGDSYSSILLHAGTNIGNLATFKILPGTGGRYAVHFAGVVNLDDYVIQISPINAESGYPAYATQEAVASLRSGLKVNGILVVSTTSGVKIYKPPTGKGASKSWDGFACRSAFISQCSGRGQALVVLGSDGAIRGYTLPGLREIGSIPLPVQLDPQRLAEAVITTTGDVLAWTSPAEVALMNVWGSGLVMNRSKDVLFNPDLAIPPRPTISNVQWITGVQHVTPADIDFLIGGPDRPPSKRVMEQPQMHDSQPNLSSQSGSSKGNQGEGYWQYMQRQITERTEKLGNLSESVDKLGETSAGWADDASKFVQKQKRNLVMGAVKSKFGV